MSLTPAQRRYNRDVLQFSAAYALLLFAAIWLFEHHIAVGTLAIFAALLPALPLIGIFAAIGRYIVAERDEYQRMLVVRQTLVASGLALTIATAWGFMESFGVARHVDAYWIAVVWFAGLGLGTCVNRVLERRA